MSRFFRAFLLLMLAFPFRAESLPDLSPRACDPPRDRAGMERELRDYLRLSEEALAMRAMAIRLYHELEARKKQGLALSGQDLHRINQGAVHLLEQRATLLETALAHECWTKTPPDADPETGDIQRAGVLVSLSAALILYDNYLSAISLFHDDADFRRHLNKPDTGFNLDANELQRADMMFASPELRQRVRRAIEWYQKYGNARSGFEGYDYLFQSIAQSPSYHFVRKRRPLYVLGHIFEVFGNFTVDSLVHLKDESSHFSSLMFGNTMGLVEMRHGKLRDKPEIERHVRGQLRAGDILLEKTPFRLTDTFIPGHWGHAAIWVGTEEELTGLGIWQHPVVQAHHAAIRDGRGVVEALRSGVETNTVAHFMNIDDLAVLRHAGMGDEDRAQTILHTLRQVGKAYDFNFNAETTDRMFCSKLIYMAYGGIDWPNSRMLGRFTISPDDIAQRSIRNGPLHIVLLYHDGKRVDAPAPVMERMLGKNPLSDLAAR
ncbi:MAG: hypothetical protein LBB76_05120 [Azoarcus sp.]|jgi:uncharacterized protein YycO|nr:hypothetical protein [Azoarcus sp.]